MNRATGYVQGKPAPIELSYIDGKGHQLESAAALSFARMAAAAQRDGVDLEVNSAFREHRAQQYLWSCWEHDQRLWDHAPESKRGPRPLRPSKPGYSLHESGLAVDLDLLDEHGHERPAAQWLREHAGEYGFVFPVDKEPWHAEYRPAKEAKTA